MANMITKKLDFSHVRSHPNKYVQFYGYLIELKKLYRQGWVKRHNMSLEKAESVSEHIFSGILFALIVLTEEEKDLDVCRTLLMFLVHDLGEILAGDLTPHDDVYEDDKYDLELKALEEIFANFSSKEFFLELWKEYEAQETPEAKFAKEIDKLDAVLMAYAYKPNGLREESLQEFVDHSDSYVTTAELRNILHSLG